MKQVKYISPEDFKKLGEILDKLSEHSKAVAQAQNSFNNAMQNVYEQFHLAEKLFENQQVEDET